MISSSTTIGIDGNPVHSTIMSNFNAPTLPVRRPSRGGRPRLRGRPRGRPSSASPLNNEEMRTFDRPAPHRIITSRTTFDIGGNSLHSTITPNSNDRITTNNSVVHSSIPTVDNARSSSSNASQIIHSQCRILSYWDCGDATRTCIHCQAILWSDVTMLRRLVEELLSMLDKNNSLVQAFRMAKDRLHESSTQSVKIRLIGNRTKDGRQYNLPTVFEVAALIPGDGSPIQCRDVLIEDRGDGTVRRISELHPSFMALQYPLLFPYGEDGFHLSIPLSSNSTSYKGKNVTLREYYCFRLHFRLNKELPSQENDPVAFEAVRSHMMHGPCGQLNTLSPCMHNGSCSKGYPKEYCDETFIRRDGWPVIKGLTMVRKLILIKYLFSYINKGHDRATAVLEGPDRTRSFISMLHNENEIEEYINCRYISISEACWKLLGFEMQYRSVAVERLPFHEEDCQRVYFREDDDIAEVLDMRVSAVSKFTEWMRANQLYPEARLLTYSDFPTKFTWHEKGDVKEWRPRKNGLVIGRLYFVNPNEGESKWILDMGVGRLPTCTVEGDDDGTWITIPDDLLIPVVDNPIDVVTSIVFPDILSLVNDISYIKERCILCPTNDDVDMINLHVLCKMSGDMHEMLSADEICRSTDNFAELEIMYSSEFLNTLWFSGIPYHKLNLKVGAPIILLRNLNLQRDHYNFAPQYVRRFTVTKYHGATCKIPNQEKTLPRNEVISQLQTTVVESLLSPSSASTDDLRNVKDEGFSASISELNHTEYKDDDVGLFPIHTNVVESVSPKSATSTVICDNHQVDVSDKLIYKDASGNMKDDTTVAPGSMRLLLIVMKMMVLQNVYLRKRMWKIVTDVTMLVMILLKMMFLRHVSPYVVYKMVGDDTIVDDIFKTPISICGLQECGESEDAYAVIDTDSSEKSFIGSSITPMKRRLPRLCEESSEDDIVS
ncbi:unnamed protein product [Lactuca virosa]|uniref:DNA helicase Pif1-like 2B domain-containing protein n=1 Tax=Lactuca virosa TaxID=75947 RepID=A0AAU9M2K0_9ASTR|nr:unnamed protein product [Lactuca virosa]